MWRSRAMHTQTDKFTLPSQAEKQSPIGTVRTDLAIESHERLAKDATAIAGLSLDREQFDTFTRIRMKVSSREASEAMGKIQGEYVTFEVPDMRYRDPELYEAVAVAVSDEVRRLIDHDTSAPVLVVGLGNWNVTPDALGPLVIDHLFVTRHLYHVMPEVLDEGFRSVCAIAPGVLGITGIESLEIVKGVVDRVKPAMVLVIDALAAGSVERVLTTIQIADSGISPGAGIGNYRKAFSRESLGVPVLAIGIPTVVDLGTMMQRAIERTADRYDPLSALHEEERTEILKELLEPLGDRLIVTPKEIDQFIEDMATVIAMGLNLALHPVMSLEDARVFLH